MASIRCGHCSASHTSTAAVKACSQGNLFTCHWTVERYVGWTDDETGYSEGEMRFEDCGADAIATERGWTCAAGHEHVSIEARHNEDWEYAEDYDEARNLALAGVEPLTMSGHLVLGPQSFAPSTYALAGVR